ncbi:MAG: DNA repair protein RadA [Anaerolineae bacterium]|nr:DNA repair protein RadA [Anaerolineae bacterium]
MAKMRVQYVCQSCGATFMKWAGRCTSCGEWNTLLETVVETRSSRAAKASLAPASQPQPLPDIQADQFHRLPVRSDELARVLGGGIVPGSVVLIGGDPGIGKSTLLLQASAQLAADSGPVLYVSAEESVQQIKMRADRLGLAQPNLYVVSEVSLDQIVADIEQVNPRLVVVDSIQAISSEELESAAGSVSQVKECATALLRLAKANGVPVFLVGHVTKAGAIAGPRVLEHIVDAVLYLEGERFHAYRLLRSVKNRFGSTHEVGVFEMGEQGLVEVPNPSEAFLAERLPDATGSVIAVTMEGTRPLLVEIQALASTTSFGLPRRTANGVDINRLLLLVAVLNKRVGLRLFDQDLFVNVIGGLKINEPAADLAVATAIASSFQNVSLPSDLAVMGEVGLSGELRAVSHLGRRLNEAAKLGFKRCIVPATRHRVRDVPEGLAVIPVRSLSEALACAVGQAGLSRQKSETA